METSFIHQNNNLPRPQSLLVLVDLWRNWSSVLCKITLFISELSFFKLLINWLRKADVDKNLKFYDFSVKTYNKSSNQNFKVRYRNEEKRRFYGKINTILKPVHQKYYFWKIKMSWRTFSYISDYQEGNKKRVFSRSLLILCNFWIYRENWSQRVYNHALL